MLGLAGLPLGLSVPVPRPGARRMRRGGRRARRRCVRRRRGARPAGTTGRTWSRTSSRTCPSRLPLESARCRLSRALEHGQDRLHEKELFRSLGIPTARFGSLEETGLPALVKTRRLGYDGKGQRRVEARRSARRGRARGGARSVRPRALDRRCARPRRRDAVLAGGRERPSRRDPPRHSRAGARRAAA